MYPLEFGISVLNLHSLLAVEFPVRNDWALYDEVIHFEGYNNNTNSELL